MSRKILVLILYLPILFIIGASYLFVNKSDYGLVPLLTKPEIIHALLTSLIYCFTVAFINLIIGHILGKQLASYHGKLLVLFDFALLLPLIIPVILIISSFHFLLIKIGLINNFLAVILINLLPTIPYSIKIFRNDFNNLGSKFFDQSKLLGASSFKTFLYVTLPTLKSSYSSAFIFAFTITLSQYAIISIIGGGRINGLAQVFFPYFSSSNTNILPAFSLLLILLSVISVVIFKLLFSMVVTLGKLR